MLLFLSTLAFAQEAPPIVNGEETSDFPAVGTLVALASNGAGGSFCSGTLAHEKWVITAAHCVEAFADMQRKGYPYFYFATGTDIYSATGIDEFVKIKNWYEHPDYNTNNLSYDIGILELEQQITSIDPVPVNDSNPQGNWDVVTYVGWGITGDSTADQYNSGVKRTADVPIYDFSYYHIYTHDSVDGKNICSGDSGGAMLYPQDGVLMLVGANSFGFDLYGGRPDCEGDGAASAATRVDTALDWLEGFVDLYRTEDFEGTTGGDGGSGDGGSGDGGTGDGGTGDGGTGDGGGDDGGGGPGGGVDTDSFDTGFDATLDEPARPSDELAGKGCSNVPGNLAGLGASLLLAIGLTRRRERYA